MARCATTVLDGRQSIAFAQQAQPQRLAYLLDDLQVWRDAGNRVKKRTRITDQLHCSNLLGL
jgi:hypothetical protein